jgi:hypothetical protein
MRCHSCNRYFRRDAALAQRQLLGGLAETSHPMRTCAGWSDADDVFFRLGWLQATVAMVLADQTHCLSCSCAARDRLLEQLKKPRVTTPTNEFTSDQPLER